VCNKQDLCVIAHQNSHHSLLASEFWCAITLLHTKLKTKLCVRDERGAFRLVCNTFWCAIEQLTDSAAKRAHHGWPPHHHRSVLSALLWWAVGRGTASCAAAVAVRRSSTIAGTFACAYRRQALTPAKMERFVRTKMDRTPAKTVLSVLLGTEKLRDRELVPSSISLGRAARGRRDRSPCSGRASRGP